MYSTIFATSVTMKGKEQERLGEGERVHTEAGLLLFVRCPIINALKINSRCRQTQLVVATF